MSTLHVRIEDKTKAAASKTLASIGLDMSTAVKLFLHQVVAEKGLPFTPTQNPAALKAKWDMEAARARNGKSYASGRDVLKDL